VQIEIHFKTIKFVKKIEFYIFYLALLLTQYQFTGLLKCVISRIRMRRRKSFL